MAMDTRHNKPHIFQAMLLRTLALPVMMTGLWGCDVADNNGTTTENLLAQCDSKPQQIAINGGSFLMGSEGFYREEGPVRIIEVKDFAIDRTEVSNAQFAEFVEATGYITVAEKQPDATLHPNIPAELLVPGSAVFISPLQSQQNDWWQFVKGANWRQPEGPGSTISDRQDHPVVHVAYADAMAYAKWAGGDLPTEEEWEYAARGGLDQQTYEWGQEPVSEGPPKANIWQGSFPVQNHETDGYSGTAPAGCFPPNGYGLHDMTGNVWEWTKDSSDPNNPNSGLVKGGSYLCATNYCRRFRPAAKQPQERDFSTSHIGFRLVYKDNDQDYAK